MSASSRPHAGIAGAGVLGRLLAWRLAHAGWRVSVVDPAPDALAPARGSLFHAPHAAGFTAAGMLSPLAELDQAEPAVAALGWRSLDLWQAVAARLPARADAPQGLVRRQDSLLLAHPSDLGAAQRVLARLEAARAQDPAWPAAQPLDAEALQTLEPALAPRLWGWRLPGEGQVLGPALLEALAADAPGVAWHWGRRVSEVSPHRLVLEDGQTLTVDLAIDARGLGARPEAEAQAHPMSPSDPRPTLRGLRGVRGEVVWLHAPGVPLRRPLRLLHPRHRVYLVPRPGDLVLLGASELDSEDRSPVSLRSAVELMAAAHSVIPELAEARIVHLEANLRPALPDHRPWVQTAPGWLAINGLFRHGWLLAPALVEQALTELGLPTLTPNQEAAHA